MGRGGVGGLTSQPVLLFGFLPCYMQTLFLRVQLPLIVVQLNWIIRHEQQLFQQFNLLHQVIHIGGRHVGLAVVVGRCFYRLTLIQPHTFFYFSR